jgi:hypothetical protein
VGPGGRFVIFVGPRDPPYGYYNGALPYGYNTVWVYDSCTGAPAGCNPATAQVNIAKDGSVANADCSPQGISSDGQFILIYTEATNLATLPSGVAGTSYIWKNPLFN